MKIGIYLFGIAYSDYAPVIQKADALGYESLWIPEHLILPAELPATYPYSPDGRAPMRSNIPMLDAFLTLGYLAAASHRIRLATGIYILPLRNPFVTARAVATLDILSNGRALLGVGVGWLREEFEIAGEAFENRGPRTDEIVEILKLLWTQDTIEFHGQFYSFGPVKFEPKPVQRPHPPILFGGLSPVALRRAARLGNGWIGLNHSLEKTREIAQRLRALRQASGREREPFEVTVGPTVPPTVDNLRRYQDAGADRVFTVPWPLGSGSTTVQQACEGLECFAQNVLSKLDD